MNFRRRVTYLGALIVALALILLLGTLLSPETRGLTAVQRQVFPALRVQNATQIAVASEKSSFTLAKKGSEGWTVAAGSQSYPASESRIQSFLQDLASLGTLRVVTANQSLYPDFSLDKASEHRVTVSAGNAKFELQYGKDAEGGGYIRIGSGKAVYLADRSLGYYLSNDVSNWYDLRLFPSSLSYRKIQELDITFLPGIDSAQRGLVKIEGKADPSLAKSVHTVGYRLVRRSTSESPNTWFFEGNLSLKLNQVSVESVAREFVMLEGGSFAPAAVSDSGVGHPGIRVTATTGDGNTYTVSVGKTAGKDLFYVRPEGPGVKTDGSGNPYTYRVSRWYLERLLKPVDNLEEKAGAKP